MKKSIEVETGFKVQFKSGIVWCGKDTKKVSQNDLDHHMQIFGLYFGNTVFNVYEDGVKIGTARKVAKFNVYVISL